MSAVRQLLQRAAQRRRCRRARLPWRELEAEAVRQGCSAADIFFDWAGRGKAIRSGLAGCQPDPPSHGQADRSSTACSRAALETPRTSRWREAQLPTLKRWASLTRHAPLPMCVSRSDDETTTPGLRVANTPRERWSTSVFSVSCSRFRGDDAIGVQGETIARFAEQGLSAMGDQSGGHVERSVG
jgi:hypothetical protein